jgi:hypothetical protein
MYADVFFFHSLRRRSFYDRSAMAYHDIDVTAVTVLGTLIVVALRLTSLCILLPLHLTTGKGRVSVARAITRQEEA